MKTKTLTCISILFLLLLCSCLHATDSLTVIKKRKKIIYTSGSAISITSYGLLYQLWYKNYPQSTFHSFNDNGEWLQMDKFGHAFSTYQLGNASLNVLRWSGCSDKKKMIAGCFSGFMYMAGVEVMDGFSKGWGFSWGDMAANLGGSGVCALQELAWQEQRIQLKFSFCKSSYAKYRPELLGSQLHEEIFKDYNGQTYWMSFNLSSLLRLTHKFPTWLNLAIGYGADGMTGGHENIQITSTDGKPLNFDRIRQYYLSLDADLSKIKSRYTWINRILRTVNCIKIPFPSLELSGKKLKGNLF